jgi:hypothetical protein
MRVQTPTKTSNSTTHTNTPRLLQWFGCFLDAHQAGTSILFYKSAAFFYNSAQLLYFLQFATVFSLTVLLYDCSDLTLGLWKLSAARFNASFECSHVSTGARIMRWAHIVAFKVPAACAPLDANPVQQLPSTGVVLSWR